LSDHIAHSLDDRDVPVHEENIDSLLGQADGQIGTEPSAADNTDLLHKRLDG
jgi:hypothetical protein